ncbi:MAG: WecB/TagA/CpsF family glycosyltransferase [Pyrinomonadaceae bacterium]|nr:WecB/TagA/CpsF family glycosyltransferase [Pyrinomonadaceae bacterium]
MKIIAPRQTKEKEKALFYGRFSSKGLLQNRLQKSVRRKSWLFYSFLVSFGKRTFDLCFSVLLICLFLPIFIFAFLLIFQRNPKLLEKPLIGQFGRIFHQYSFNLSWISSPILTKIAGLPVLFNILKGEMSFIGPRAIEPIELDLREHSARRRMDVRPGLFCLWWIRRRANIDYGSEFGSDSEYVNSHGVWNDLGIAARTIPAFFYGGNSAETQEKIKVLGLPINNTSMKEAVDLISEKLHSTGSAVQFCFVNADCANLSVKNTEYKAVLNRAQFVFADGIGMKIAGKLLKTGIKQNVNGTDLFPRLCEKLSGTGKKIFLLGAKPKIADAVANWVKTNFPETEVCGTQHGYYSSEDEPRILQKINESQTDLLLVAFGAPRQDVWIAENLPNLKIKAAIGVGGLFDYFSGRIPRAPQWLREMGLEWFFRFYQEPRRMWRRYFLGNFVFLSRVILEKTGKKNY